MTWARRPRNAAAKKALAPKTAKLHKRKKMKMPRAALTDPWKHIGMARGQR